MSRPRELNPAPSKRQAVIRSQNQQITIWGGAKGERKMTIEGRMMMTGEIPNGPELCYLHRKAQMTTPNLGAPIENGIHVNTTFSAGDRVH
jgi:hypothetical protein